MPSGVAQVTLDGTTATTISGNCQDSCIISGQDQAGGNLFHSFQDFSIDEGNQITFTHGSGIEHIFSRVTGDNQSSILGTLAVEGNADFFLLNPNGIIFGPDATLDMRGSFIGTTASSILFEDGIEFSADDTSAPLLTVSAPVGLQFGSNVGSIENQSQSSLNGVLNAQGTPTGLLVDAGQRLALVGGTLSLVDGNLTAPGGRIDLVSVGANEQVLLVENEQGLIPQPDLSAALGDIVIQQSAIDVSGSVSDVEEGGGVALWGDTIFLEDSDIRAETTASQDGGTLWIQANELTLSNSRIQSITFSDATGADVELMVGTLSLSDGSVIAAETDNGGQSGDLTINADRIGLFSSDMGTETRGAGNAGNVTIETGLLGAVDSGILANSFGSGDGGSIRLRATDFVELVGNSVIAAAVDLSEGAAPSTAQGGTAGEIAIATNRLTLRDLAQIATDSFGNAGAAGDISITATDIELLGTPSEEFPVGLFSQIDVGSSGQGGSIDLTTETLLIQDGAQIGVSTLGPGPAGHITIQASDWIDITGDTSTGIFAQVESDATGPGGRLTVNTPQLQLVGSGARLSATTLGQGQGGNVDVQAQSLVMAEGAQIQAATLGFAPGGILTVNTTSTVLRGTDASGQVSTALVTSTLGDEPAGDLILQTETLRIEDGARISASTSGGGAGGNLVVQASGGVEVIGSAASTQRPSGLFVEASGAGPSGNLSLLADSLLLDQQATINAEATSEDGGNIQLQVDKLISLRHNSSISATAGLASGAGDGGNITIDTPFLIALPAENSDITANAFEGQGGNIQITAQTIVGLQPRPTLTPSSDITASSEFGTDGTIVIESPDVEPEEGLVDLPAQVVDVTRLIAQGCSPNTNYAYSEFSLTGQGGVPTNPAGLLSSHTLLNDLGLPFDQTAATSTLEAWDPRVESSMGEDVRSPTQPTITEAKEWRITPQGQVVLTSDASRLISNRLWSPQTNCSQSYTPHG